MYIDDYYVIIEASVHFHVWEFPFSNYHKNNLDFIAPFNPILTKTSRNGA